MDKLRAIPNLIAYACPTNPPPLTLTEMSYLFSACIFFSGNLITDTSNGCFLK